MTFPKSAIPILKKYFVFDCIFDLLDYDMNMSQLHDELKSLKKDNFESNYRFIFLHYDTEYYITPDSPAGLTIINLQKILESLDISNYFCILLTQQNLQPMCDYVRQKFTTDDCSIAVINNYLHYHVHPVGETYELELNEKLISKKYITLNKIGRFHRRVVVSLLKHKNLLQHGIVSFRARK